MYAEAADPWQLEERWYEQRKYAITTGVAAVSAVPARVRAGLLDRRAHREARSALRPRDGHRRRRSRARAADHRRLSARLPDSASHCCVVAGRAMARNAFRPGGALGGRLLPEAGALRTVLDRECPGWRVAATVVAAHWRHRSTTTRSGGPRQRHHRRYAWPAPRSAATATTTSSSRCSTRAAECPWLPAPESREPSCRVPSGLALQYFSFAFVVGHRGGTVELVRRIDVASQPGQQFTAHAR